MMKLDSDNLETLGVVVVMKPAQVRQWLTDWQAMPAIQSVDLGSVASREEIVQRLLDLDLLDPVPGTLEPGGDSFADSLYGGLAGLPVPQVRLAIVDCAPLLKSAQLQDFLDFVQIVMLLDEQLRTHHLEAYRKRLRLVVGRANDQPM